LEIGDPLTFVDLPVEGVYKFWVEAATHSGLAGSEVADAVVLSAPEFRLQTIQVVTEGGTFGRCLGAQFGNHGAHLRESSLQFHPALKCLRRKTGELGR
jgi:hypothetical protein